MATPLIDDPKSWTWPADVRAKFDRQRIAIPEAKPEPPKPAASEPTDPTDELLSYMFGGL